MVGFVYSLLMTQKERAERALRYYRCCLCGFLTDEDYIVWRGPLLTKGVCPDCEPEGDDNR